MNIPKRFNIESKKNRYEYNIDKDTIKIPSNYYPLNDKPKLFFKENTKFIIDEKIIELIDSIEYKVGHCYTNADNIADLLVKYGYKAEVYVGWHVGMKEIPMHHSWVVLQNEYIIDISDEFDCFFYNVIINNIKWDDLDLNEQRKLFMEYRQEAKKHKNSERCHLGIASNNSLYIGSKCSGLKGKLIFNDLLEKYKDHPCIVKETDANGKTPIQKMMDEEKLL